MIIAGRLDQIVDIQELTVTVDSMGSTVEAWATDPDAPTRAEHVPMSGAERLEVGKVGAVNPAKFRIRRYGDLTVRHRVVHQGRTYKINGIEDYYRRGRDQVLHCQEVT